jgi:hypothetical protein
MAKNPREAGASATKVPGPGDGAAAATIGEATLELLSARYDDDLRQPPPDRACRCGQHVPGAEAFLRFEGD